jgi:hypothetical protein
MFLGLMMIIATPVIVVMLLSSSDLATFNLIDRINLFFKGNTNVVFSDEEKVWVDRTAKTETPDDVLTLAEELIAWMSDNPESMGSPDESDEGESGEFDSAGQGESGSSNKQEGKKDDISKDVSGSGVAIIIIRPRNIF